MIERDTNTYNVDDFHEFNSLNVQDLKNRLFCSFTTLEGLESLVDNITSKYEVVYNKIFVLHIKGSDEYVCTYNIDNVNVADIPHKTILVHRKKDTNTLYTINALNEVIKELNGGVVDVRYPVEWKHYQNTILLTQHDELKELKTKIYKIIETK
tara:strand:- start:458 stop:919 length:462 start_codon:yes stop_codon:yes gene_type:complete